MASFKKAILMNIQDNVATALMSIDKDEKAVVVFNNEIVAEVTVVSDIEAYHKIALMSIEERELVYKYGEVIGRATSSIRTGEHVHVNNIESVMTA